MTTRTKGVVVVTLEAGVDFQRLENRLSQINGVKRVDFDHLTRKLLVQYESMDTGTRKIESEIDELLDGRLARRKHLVSLPRKKTISRPD